MDGWILYYTFWEASQALNLCAINIHIFVHFCVLWIILLYFNGKILFKPYSF